jgi:hypothetical protein
MGSHIPKLLQEIKKGDADVVIGSRFAAGDKDAFRSTFLRRIGIFFFTHFVFLLTHQKFTDPTSGFTVANRKAFEKFSRFFPEDHPPPETLVLLSRWGMKVAEVPASMRERQGSISSINAFGSIYFMIKVSLAILVDLLRKF